MDEALTFEATDEELVVFLAETDELLQSLETSVVRLEREEVDAALLNQVFRIMHTIKGSAATIGHPEMAQLAHRLEDLLDRCRSGVLRVTAAVADVLLLSLDALRTYADEVRSRRRIGTNLAELLAQVERTIGSSPGEEPANVGPPPTTPPILPTLPSTSDPLLAVKLVFAETTPLPAARALIAVMDLDQIGDVMWCSPTRAEIESGSVERTLEVLVATDVPPERIKRMFEDVGEYESVAVVSQIPTESGGTSIASSDGQSISAEEAKSPSPSDTSTDPALPRFRRASPTVRIDVAQLDALLNLVGELVIDRTRLRDVATRAEALAGVDGVFEELAATALHLERVTNDLQAEILKARMLPIDHVFNRFPRLVRDLARRFGKEVDLVIDGADTELDRTVIEEVGDPLIHLIRNSVDHGIESPVEREATGKPRRGTIRLAARHEAGQVVIDVSDDGRGLDGRRILASARDRGIINAETAERLDPSEAIDLIFLPGVSTAKTVSDVSGRGVGMDVVRANIEKLNGSVGIRTAPGVGTTFSLRLPLTLAIVPALLVAVDRACYALPLSSVLETFRVEPAALRRANHRLLVDVRGEALPLVPLAALLGRPAGERSRAVTDVAIPGGRLLTVAVQHGTRQVGLIVDQLIGEQEIVIKPLDPLVGAIDGVAGAAILGDGRIAPILYVPGLMKDLLQAGTTDATTRAGLGASARKETAKEKISV